MSYTEHRRKNFSKRSLVARKAIATLRKNKKGTNPAKPELGAAQKAVATMKKGRRIQIHSPAVNMNSEQTATYAPPAKWWSYMTEQGHGPENKPLSAAAAGHLWFKVYDNKKRLEIIKQYG